MDVKGIAVILVLDGKVSRRGKARLARKFIVPELWLYAPPVLVKVLAMSRLPAGAVNVPPVWRNVPVTLIDWLERLNVPESSVKSPPTVTAAFGVKVLEPEVELIFRS